jgi:Type I phosphodiesterase / nucleotide pyrophosphatase
MLLSGDLENTGREPSSRVHVFVLIDALGWKFLEGRQFLSDLLPFRKSLRTVLGFSSGAIPTILTGLQPVQTGHWNLLYYDPQGSPFRWLRHFRLLPDAIMNHRVIRKLMQQMGRWLLGLGPHFDCCVAPKLLPWFNWVEKRNIYASGGITGAPSIFDHLVETGIPHRIYTYHDWTDAEILRLARRDMEGSEALFFFIYLSEMDMLLHNQWKEPQLLEEPLKRYEAGLRRIFEAGLERDPGATFAVFSDHGMTPVHGSFDLVGEVASLGFSMPEDYLAVYDSTMGRFWFFKESSRTAILQHLGELACGRLLSDPELEDLGILFPDRRYGEAIFLLNPGWLLTKSDFNGPRWTPAGMHGYHPDEPYSDAVFLSNHQPRFPVRTIADVHRCMEEACRHTCRRPRPTHELRRG